MNGRNPANGERWWVKFICRIPEQSGIWMAERASQDVGPIRVTGPARDEALRKMEGEIRYWLEICPFGGQALRNLEVELACEDTA